MSDHDANQVDSGIRAAGDVDAHAGREGDHTVADVCETAGLKLDAIGIHPINTRMIESRNDYADGRCDPNAGNAVVNRRVFDVNFLQR